MPNPETVDAMNRMSAALDNLGRVEMDLAKRHGIDVAPADVHDAVSMRALCGNPEDTELTNTWYDAYKKYTDALKEVLNCQE